MLPRTWVEVLRKRAVGQPAECAFTFLENGEEESVSISFDELERFARANAVRVRQHVAVGEPVLLLFPSGLDFIAAFFGCLYAGVIPVPAFPPRNRSRSTDRLDSVVTDSGAKLVLTCGMTMNWLVETGNGGDLLKSLTWLATDECDINLSTEWQEPTINSDTVALLQYTSGSTARPKGVIVAHGNLLYNAAMLHKACVPSERNVLVSWLPMYHDMGLIGSVLQSVFAGHHSVLMSPESFLMKPSRWLHAITKYRAYGSVAPNFSYDLCARRITEEQKSTLDLSSWKLAMTGAEPVRNETLQRFSEAFSDCGFRSTAFYSCYGLAEATLFVTGGTVAESPTMHSFDRDALLEKRVVPADEMSLRARKMVGCGKAWLGQQIVIVDPASATECTAGQIGEICIQGPGVAKGYWNNPEASREIFGFYLATGKGPLLRTGDLGFVFDGELFIAGRSKDIIIVAGRNHCAEDIERTVEEADRAVRCNGVAAFVIDYEHGERPVVVAELDRHCVSFAHKARDDETGVFADITRKIRGAVSKQHDVSLHDIQLVKPLAIPKTSSGKVQRNACRTLYLDSKLKTILT